MIIYGKQPVLHLLEKHPKKVKEVFLNKEIDKALFSKITKTGAKIIRVDNKKAQAMAKNGNHQGILADIEEIEFTPIKELVKNDFLLVLCGVTDIGNIGSITRTAFALGVDGIILTGVNGIKLEGAVRTSSGALLDLPIGFEKNPMEVVNQLKMSKFASFGSSLDGDSKIDYSSYSKKALFLGSEGEGLPKKVVRAMDRLTKIEMSNNFDSLNVSVAAGILIDRMKSCN
ncbi:MAG: 23S rRNA (guanosine(2251)-2'-O)-methyltransferase RlmB [Campylobacterales bacterium]|nr:23S rRNA (guanosine(2251)-2'-O)-methyltransferase RlmB [Campylobacterales bacterium]